MTPVLALRPRRGAAFWPLRLGAPRLRRELAEPVRQACKFLAKRVFHRGKEIRVSRIISQVSLFARVRFQIIELVRVEVVRERSGPEVPNSFLLGVPVRILPAVPAN